MARRTPGRSSSHAVYFDQGLFQILVAPCPPRECVSLALSRNTPLGETSLLAERDPQSSGRSHSSGYFIRRALRAAPAIR